MIQAVTFDFWDTITVDDSDEPKRTALGLPTKPQARLQLLMDEVLRHHLEAEHGVDFPAFLLHEHYIQKRQPGARCPILPTCMCPM